MKQIHFVNFKEEKNQENIIFFLHNISPYLLRVLNTFF